MNTINNTNNNTNFKYNFKFRIDRICNGWNFGNRFPDIVCSQAYLEASDDKEYQVGIWEEGGWLRIGINIIGARHTEEMKSLLALYDCLSQINPIEEPSFVLDSRSFFEGLAKFFYEDHTGVSNNTYDFAWANDLFSTLTVDNLNRSRDKEACLIYPVLKFIIFWWTKNDDSERQLAELKSLFDAFSREKGLLQKKHPTMFEFLYQRKIQDKIKFLDQFTDSDQPKLNSEKYSSILNRSMQFKNKKSYASTPNLAPKGLSGGIKSTPGQIYPQMNRDFTNKKLFFRSQSKVGLNTTVKVKDPPPKTVFIPPPKPVERKASPEPSGSNSSEKNPGGSFRTVFESVLINENNPEMEMRLGRQLRYRATEYEFNFSQRDPGHRMVKVENSVARELNAIQNKEKNFEDELRQINRRPKESKYLIKKHVRLIDSEGISAMLYMNFLVWTELTLYQINKFKVCLDRLKLVFECIDEVYSKKKDQEGRKIILWI